MNLLHRVTAVLDGAGIAHALIGALTLAAHGVARSTVDQDLLAVDRSCLDPILWQGLEAEGVAPGLLAEFVKGPPPQDEAPNPRASSGRKPHDAQFRR